MPVDGARIPALPILRRAGLEPLELRAKEGLALINGTQSSTALALHALLSSEPVFEAALVVGRADGRCGPWQRRSIRPAHPRAARPARSDRRSQILPRAARQAARSAPRTSEVDERVQDPYCLRCQPQVVGACLDQLRHAARVLMREANAVTDNPLVFPDEDAILSGGNFHAEPVALACDAMAVAIAEIGAIAERRVALLMDSSASRLPSFLTADTGLNSGFMIAHVTAASLASENKSMAHPASVDSLPTSANQEDHVSMATFAARRLEPMITNTAHILGIELLASSRGIEFLRPLASSPPLEAAYDLVRAACPSSPRDHYLAPAIERASSLVTGGSVALILRSLPGLPALWTSL